MLLTVVLLQVLWFFPTIPLPGGGTPLEIWQRQTIVKYKDIKSNRDGYKKKVIMRSQLKNVKHAWCQSMSLHCKNKSDINMVWFYYNEINLVLCVHQLHVVFVALAIRPLLAISSSTFWALTWVFFSLPMRRHMATFIWSRILDCSAKGFQSGFKIFALAYFVVDAFMQLLACSFKILIFLVVLWLESI